MNPRRILGSSQFVAAALLLSSTWAVAGLSHMRQGHPLARPLQSIPMQIGHWRSTENQPLPEIALDMLKATDTLSRSYRDKRASLDLFLAYYHDQRAGESLHSPRHCLPGTGWDVLDHRTVQVPVDGVQRTINQYTVRREKDKLVVLYWYQSKGRTIASEYAGKFWLVWDGVITGNTGAAIVRVTVPPALLPEGLKFAGQTIHYVEECFGQ